MPSDKLDDAASHSLREQDAFNAWWKSRGDHKFDEHPALAAGAAWMARSYAVPELQPIPPTGDSPFNKNAADYMAACVDVLVRRKALDARSIVADARLNYGQPFTNAEEVVFKGDKPVSTTGALDWKPVEDAPRDGTHLLFWNGRSWEQVWWSEISEDFINERGYAHFHDNYGRLKATHFSIPSGPVSATQERK